MSRRASVTAVSKNLLCQQMSGQIILQDKQALCHPRFQKAKLPPPWQEAASISKSIYIKLLLHKSKHCSGSMTATLLATSGSLSSWRDEILWFSTTLKYNHFKFFQVWIGCLKVLEAIAYCANEKKSVSYSRVRLSCLLDGCSLQKGAFAFMLGLAWDLVLLMSRQCLGFLSTTGKKEK